MPPDIDERDPVAVSALLERAAEALCASPFRQGSAERLPARGRIVVSGDLHDNIMHLERLLRLARLDGAVDHHLLVQELIHGGHLFNSVDLSHRMLLRVAALVVDHPGQVHPVLANHELAQQTGRGVSKGAGNSVELFDRGVEYVYGGEAERVGAALRRFMEAMPLALLSESGLCCAHSLPDEQAMVHFDPAVLDRPLAPEDLRAPHGSAYLMVWGRRYSSASCAALAERWGVKLFCLGHRHVESGVELVTENALVLNSDHAAGRALVIDLARLPAPEEALIGALPLSGGAF